MKYNAYKDCADCGGYDLEWMDHCQKHKGVWYCRGCQCPFCVEDDLEEYDQELMDYLESDGE